MWDAHSELNKQYFSSTGDSKIGEKKKLSHYLQGRVQNAMNANDLPEGLLPCFLWTSDLEAKQGEFLGLVTFGLVS
jgi:hypothetical protein